MADINDRLRIVQSWWLGSELVRRHPDLILIETHSGGGQDDCLTLVRPQRHDVTALVQMNRVGAIHVGEMKGFMTWEAERDFGDRHGAVRRIETGAGLPAPKATLPSTPAVLTLRAISRVLTSMLNEREPWDARNAYVDLSGAMGSEVTDLSDFPSAANSMAEHRPNDLYGQPGYRFWRLVHGESAVAVLDTDGVVHLKDGHMSLNDAYVKSGRSLTRAIAATLGPALP